MFVDGDGPAMRIRERRLRAFQRYVRWTVRKTQSRTPVGVRADDVVPAAPNND